MRFRATLLAFSAASFACSRLPPGGVAVGTVYVSEGNLAGVPELGVPMEQVRKELQLALEKTRRFAVREGGVARVRLEVESARRVSGPEHELAEVQLLVELTAPTPQGDMERTVSEGAGRSPTGAEGGDPETRLAAFDGALRAALDDAARGLAWQLDARRKSEEELVRDLSDPDARVRDYAIRALADRRSPAAVPQLLERLNDDNPAVALRAVGALVAIGDRRAVGPLIEMTHKRPAPMVTQVLYALASLGGPTAEAFLYTLESGSPDDEVRRAATDALAELRHKRDEASARDVRSSPKRPGAP
jgi:hypothetical protein